MVRPVAPAGAARAAEWKDVFDMAWAYLILAGLFEIGFALTLKLSDGFTRLWPTLVFFLCLVISLVLLVKAAEALPIGTTYAVWTGIGAAGAVIVGIVFFDEPVTAPRLICLTALIASIIGLRLVTPT
jgi:quaternary ammonium compound-resistance protein SugE